MRVNNYNHHNNVCIILFAKYENGRSANLECIRRVMSEFLKKLRHIVEELLTHNINYR